MKKIVSFAVMVLVVCIIVMPVSADTQLTNLNLKSESYIDELIDIFPEANLDKEELLRGSSQYELHRKKNIVATYVKIIDDIKYELVKYDDNSLMLFKEHKEAAITRSSYNKLFEFSSFISGQVPSFLYLRVYYDYVGIYDRPEITSISTSSSYVTIKGSHHNEEEAEVHGNAYYEIPGEILGVEYVNKVYYAGMYIEVQSSVGHQFLVDKDRCVQY